MIDSAKCVEWSDAVVLGGDGRRLMVVLAAPGCTYARDAGGCTNCSFPASLGTGAPVSAEELVRQLDRALVEMPSDPEVKVELDLFCSGSFFNPEEIPTAAQKLMLERIAGEKSVALVLLESRPEFVTRDVVAKAVRALEPAVLEVGIGLESADEEIRERRIRKGFTWAQFEEAAGAVAAAGARLLVYVLLKPLATSEAEAVEDAVETAKRVFDLGGRLGLQVRVALEPCFVGPGTALEKAYKEGRYRPPWLWSAVAVLRRIAGMGQVVVGLSDEGMSSLEAAHNCDECTPRIRGLLASFNRTGDLWALIAESCSCARQWEEEMR